jgi:hypothetical protein
MPIGYLVTVAFVAVLTVFALAPIRHPRTLGLLSWGLGLVINELPFLAFYWLLAATLLAFGQGRYWLGGRLGGVRPCCADVSVSGSHCMARMACGASDGTGHE